MRTIRRLFPQIYERNKAGNTYYEVSARSKRYGLNTRKNFTSQKEAFDFARQLEEKVTQSGKAGLIRTIDTTDADTQALIDRLKPHNKTLKDAVDHYIGWLGEQTKKALIPDIGKLVDQWEAEKLVSKINPLAGRTKTELKSYARWLRYKFGTSKPADIDKPTVVNTLNKLDVANRTRKQYLRYCRMFFIWAKNEGHASYNPTDGIKIKTPAYEAAYYTPQQTETLLRLVQEQYPTMVGYYTLAIFAGLRPSECLRVNWSHISNKTGEIYVGKGKKEARRFSLHETALKWLKTLPKDKPLIPTKNVANVNKQIRLAFIKTITTDGKEPTWIQDGLRHGFATYFNALKQDGGYAVAHCLGDDIRTVKRHYMRAVSKEDMDAFWSILPNTKE